MIIPKAEGKAYARAEEGRYSRLYFNPEADKVRAYWSDYIEFKHGKCEDSGIGDLDILTTEENGDWGVI